MLFKHVLLNVSALTSLVLAVPTTPEFPYPVPSTNNFPHPNAKQLHHIETAADGLVNTTNTPPRPKLSSKDITDLQLVVFNEFFETAFFSSLLHNITNNVTGYEYTKKPELVSILKNILAQEKLHALNAISILQASDAFVPSPCKYQFGSTTLQHAINFAQVFTTIFMGTLQDIAVSFSRSNPSQVRAIAAMIANEAEQCGYFRHMLEKKPSAHPFPTTSLPSFLFSALNIYTVPGSCPFAMDRINVTVLRPFQLDGVGMIRPEDQTLSFTTDMGNNTAAARGVSHGTGSGLFVTYLNAQLKPISEPATKLRWNGTVLTVDAKFPYSKYLMTGLSLAALTTRGDFSSVDAVPEFTLAAPAVMQADHYLNPEDKIGGLE